MVQWAEPQVSHPQGSAGQCFPTLIRTNIKKKKKKRDKQLILEVVLATYVCLRDSILKVRLSQTKCLHVSQAEGAAHLFSEMEHWMCSRITWNHSP